MPDTDGQTIPPLRMAIEAAESGARAREQLARCAPLLKALGERLRREPPPVVITCARGSSDHAATYGKYLIEMNLGVPVASIGPSVVSMYKAPLRFRGALFIAVSQSGRSPDLLKLAEAARAGGAVTVALVNVEDSPLAAICEHVVPLCAGPETSVAATKSYLMACLAFLQLVAAWDNRPDLAGIATSAPDLFDRAAALDWHPVLSRIASAPSLFVIGRGLGMGPALEVALKCKETCRLHAEAFSGAEVAHGPMALVRPGFKVVALQQDDATGPSTRAALEGMAAAGAEVLAAGGPVDGALALPSLPDAPPELGPLAQVLSFYMAVGRVARGLGLDPDRPQNLRKVTETL